MNPRREPTETLRIHVSTRDVIFTVASQYGVKNVDAVDGIIAGWNSLTDEQQRAAMGLSVSTGPQGGTVRIES